MESDVIVFLSCGSEHPDCIFDIALDLSSRSFILPPPYPWLGTRSLLGQLKKTDLFVCFDIRRINWIVASPPSLPFPSTPLDRLSFVEIC